MHTFAIAPVEVGSLSHYLPRFQHIQTVVGNGISEPSTVRVLFHRYSGDVYLCFEGGPGVSEEARVAFGRGDVAPMIDFC